MKKFITLILAMTMMIGASVVGAVSLKSLENNSDRYLKVNSTATTATYIDQKSVELERAAAPYYEIESKRIIVDYANKEIVKYEVKYFYDILNKDEVKYVFDDKEVYNFKGHELLETSAYDGLKVANKDDENFKYADIAFSLIYGHSFSK